jgi:hypothetical protein
MPKKQINVVNLSDVKPIDEATEIQQPENDERTQIKQAIEMDEQQQPPEENTKPKRKTPTKKTSVDKPPELPTSIATIEEPTTETVVIPVEDTKPKRKTPTKKTQVDKTPATIAPVEKTEDTPKESTPKQKQAKKTKTADTQPKNNTSSEIIKDEVPVKRRTKQPTIINNIVEITPDIIENHLRKVRETKLQQRQEKIQKLISKIV